MPLPQKGLCSHTDQLPLAAQEANGSFGKATALGNLDKRCAQRTTRAYPHYRLGNTVMGYAIIEDGGRQYKVHEGEVLEVDYRGLAPGQSLAFDRVVALRDDQGLSVGQPYVEGARVSAEVVGTALGPKLVVQHFRRRKTYRKKTGHRQLYNRVKITQIQRAGADVSQGAPGP